MQFAGKWNPAASVGSVWALAVSGLRVMNSKAPDDSWVIWRELTYAPLMNSINFRMRPNNDGTGTQWTGNWTSGLDAKRPMPFKAQSSPFGPRTQRNFLVRR